MKVLIHSLLLLLLFAGCSSSTLTPETQTTASSATLAERLTYATFSSTLIGEKKYSVMLPESYAEATEKQFPVIYMMDAQNLYFDSLSYSKHAWRIHTVLDSLVQLGKAREAIIVGLDNAGIDRFSEYMPQAPVESLPADFRTAQYEQLSRPVFSDTFLQFLVTELKPEIDRNYRTKADAANTIIGGSSMGGLISMYAACEYPEVFQTSLCLSTHWPIALDDQFPIIPEAILSYFAENLPPPSHHRWYFDYGTEGLDQYYEKYQKQADLVLEEAGYSADNVLSLKFDGHDHSERSWYERLAIPLRFALGTDN